MRGNVELLERMAASMQPPPAVLVRPPIHGRRPCRMGDGLRTTLPDPRAVKCAHFAIKTQGSFTTSNVSDTALTEVRTRTPRRDRCRLRSVPSRPRAT